MDLEVAQVHSPVHICQNASCRREFSEPVKAREPNTSSPKCIFCGSTTKKVYSAPHLTVLSKSEGMKMMANSGKLTYR